ncbi:MAG: hypothetical protein AB8G05_22150 [Oligoflexales bacterium]
MAQLTDDEESQSCGLENKKRKVLADAETVLKNKQKKFRTKLFEQRNARSKLLEVAERLNQVENELLYEFVGWNTQIKRLMAAARVIILQPDMVKKPFVVPLIGFPGYGKTTLIQRWLTKMKWGHRFTQVNLKKDSPSLPTDELVAAGELEGQEKEEVQQVILYDEIQNLMRYDELYPDSNDNDVAFGTKEDGNNLNQRAKEEDARDLNRKRQIRERDHLLLWNILGNGTLIGESHFSPDKYLEQFNGINSRHIDAKKNLQSHEKELDQLNIDVEEIKYKIKLGEEKQKNLRESLNALKKNNQAEPEDQDSGKIDSQKEMRKNLEKINDELSQLRSDKYNLEDKIDTIKGKVSSSVRSIDSLKDKDLLNLLTSLKKDFPAMLGYKSYLPEKVLTEEFLNNPDDYLQLMKETRKGIQKDKTTHFQRVIIIITGNPEESIRKVTDTFSEVPENEIDPDSLRQRIVELVAPDEMKKWFRNIFGSKAGLESRLRLSAWEFIFPFSISQWEELIDRNLSHLNDSLSRDLKGMGVNTELVFDQSVHQMLYIEGVNPLQGPRGFFDVSAEIFGSFITKLKLDLISLPAQRILPKIKVSFNGQKEQLEARTDDESINIDFKVGLKKRTENNNLHSQSLKEKRNFIHHVAYCVAGSLYFKKFPITFSYRVSDKNEYIPDLWPSEDIGNLFYKKNLLYTLIAAYAADLEYFPAFSQSSQGREFRTLGKEHLDGIRKDLSEKRKNLDLSKADNLPLKEITPELADDKFFQLLDENESDEALIFALGQVRSLLKEEKSLMRKLAFELNQKHELNAEALANIFYENSANRSHSWLRRSIPYSYQANSKDILDEVFALEAEPMDIDPPQAEVPFSLLINSEDSMDLD